jgi:glycosyltransferase involved in cell wall biosynthesis
MRILHFSQSLPGGPASYLEELAPAQLSEIGAENLRFVLPSEHRDQVPSIPDSCFRGFAQTRRTLRDLAQVQAFVQAEIAAFRPDIVHLHSSFAGGLVRLPALFKARDFKIVYCAHGWAFAREGGRLKNRCLALAERVMSVAADAIVNISESEERAALDYGLDGRKMTTIRNGIARITTPANPKSFGDKGINLLFVGRHDPQKGLDILLEAMSALERDDVHLHVLGSAVVSNSTYDHAPTRNVTFHGWADRETVFRRMISADAVVMPSRWEGFGLVAVEAMRLGRPVIASERGALPEIVRHGETGLIFDPADRNALIAILRKLDRRDLESMGAKAEARFATYFTSDRMNKALLELYRSLLATPDRRLAAAALTSVQQNQAPATIS